VQQVKDGVEWVGDIGQNINVLPRPCEIVEIHNLPQNLLVNSFTNALHNYGAGAKPHGLFFFIYIGFFHTK
jgi:hypothetical protein